MKKLLFVLLLAFPFLLNAQCPTWFKSAGDATILITKTERFTSLTLSQQQRQPNTNYYYADKDGKAKVSLHVNKDETINGIDILGDDKAIQQMFDEYFKGFETCVKGKGASYVQFEKFKVVIEEVPANKRQNLPARKLITITPN